MTDGHLPFMQGVGRRNLAAVVAVALAVVLLPLGGAHAEDRLNMTVLSGSDNVAAAIAWSKQAHTTANDVMLGRDDLAPDNLTSGLLQGLLAGPLLLTRSTSLHADVKTELTRLGAKTVHILGGTSAVSTSVENEIKALGLRTRRYSGASRIDTAIEIARQYGGSATTALLARAFGTPAGDETAAWADALAGGAWSAQSSLPVLLSQSDVLTQATADYLTSSRVKTVNILGGTAAISSTVEAQLRALGMTVTRVSGPTRFATAVEINKARGYATAATPATIVLADGQNTNAWAAGFAAAGYAGAGKALVLSNGSSLPAETDAWFAGGTSSKNLIVAPYVVEAASTAAANKLSLLKRAIPSLDATSFVNNGNITGKILPMDDFKSATIAGACVTAGALSPAASTGAFSVQVANNFAPGSCELTFAVTHKNDAVVTDKITTTIAGPGPNAAVLDAPELTNVTFSSQTTDHVVLKFAFDEAVNSAVDANFKIYSFDGTPLDADAPTLPAARPDPADTKSILVSFKRPEYERSTSAAVLAGAVKDFQQVPNPEGSRGLQAISFEAGRTAAPDLVSVSLSALDRDTGTPVDPAIRATFTFDKAATRVGTPDYFITAGLDDATAVPPIDEGDDLSMTYVSGDGTIAHVMDFQGAGWTTVAAAQQALNTIKRARVPAGAVVDNKASLGGVANLELTVPITNTSGTATMNFLTSVSLDPVNSKVTYVFNDVLGAATLVGDGDQFFVYTHAGGIVTGNGAVNPDKSVSKTVVVTFATGALDGQVTGAGYDPTGATNMDPDMFRETKAAGASRTFASGETLAPDLVSVARIATSSPDPFGGSTVTKYKVVFTFNKKVTLVLTSIAFYSYVAATPSSGGTPFVHVGAGDECQVNPDDAKKVDCTVDSGNGAHTNFSAVKDAALFSVLQGAVKAQGTAAGVEYKNYASSKVPTAS